MARSKILKKKIPFGKPIIDKKEINLVNSVLKNNILVHGPKSIEFENKFGLAVDALSDDAHWYYNKEAVDL